MRDPYLVTSLLSIPLGRPTNSSSPENRVKGWQANFLPATKQLCDFGTLRVSLVLGSFICRKSYLGLTLYGCQSIFTPVNLTLHNYFS